RRTPSAASALATRLAVLATSAAECFEPHTSRYSLSGSCSSRRWSSSTTVSCSPLIQIPSSLTRSPSARSLRLPGRIVNHTWLYRTLVQPDGSSVAAHELTTPGVVERAALRFGDREGLVDGELRLSFAALADRIDESARAFVASGIEPGDRVAVWAPNIAEW